MKNDSFDFLETKKCVLVHTDEDDFCVMDQDGNFYLIEDAELCHSVILQMLENENPIYSSVETFQLKKSVPKEEYPEYKQRYAQYWDRYQNQITIVIEKKHDLFKCAWLIKQFEPSLSIGVVKTRLLHGNCILEVSDCNNPIKNKALCEFLRELQREGAKVELYRCGRNVKHTLQED